MHFESFSNEKKLNINKSDEKYQHPPVSQLAEVNRTRKILRLLIWIEIVLSIISIIIVIYSYIFGYTLEFELYNAVLRLLPFLSCTCFGFGLIAADRYHVNYLFLFIKLVMIDIILTYLSLTVFIIIPICIKKYAIGIVPTVIFAMSYLMIFCVISILPAYTVRYANKLAKLLSDAEYLTFEPVKSFV